MRSVLHAEERKDRAMNDNAQFQKVSMVRFERLLPGPIDRVWEFLVDTTRLPGWFGEGKIEPRMGGAVTFMSGHIRGVVTEWKPPRRLTYTWNVFDPGDTESPYAESYVSFELAPQGDEVLLVLTHLPIPERFEKQNAMGWHTFLDLLSVAARGETPGPRDTYMERNAERYGVDLSNLER
jgi:uncharacterized protein YndB with AHSA1/START domain